MILSYRDKKTEQLARGEFVKAFQGFEDQAARRLSILNAALSLDTLRALPGNRLETLKGDRAGQYSIRINQQWRISRTITEEWGQAMFMRAVHPGEVLKDERSEEHTSELQSLMRISYAVFCLKKKKKNKNI